MTPVRKPSPPQPPAPPELAVPLQAAEDPVHLSRRPSQLPWRLEHLSEVTSTNRLLLERASSGEPEGLILSAEQQTGGRGRLGRSWYSPPGLNLYLSVLLRPRLAPPMVPYLSFVAGLAVWKALHSLGCPVQLKWPNDVVGGLEHRKVAGILSELKLDGDQVESVVIGIGLNVHAPAGGFPAELAARATCVSTLAGRAFRRQDVLSALVEHLEHTYLTYLSTGVAPLLECWRQAALPPGTPYRFVQDGRVQVGTSLGLDEEGALLLLCDGTLRRMTAGDVELIRVERGETPSSTPHAT